MKIIKPGPEKDTPRGVRGGAEISPLTAGAANIYMAVCRVPPASRHGRTTTTSARAPST